jgi:hypothetical protein
MNGLKVNVLTIEQKTLTSTIFKQLPELEMDNYGVVNIGGQKCGFLSEWISGLVTETREKKIVALADLTCDKAGECFGGENGSCEENSLDCPLWTEDVLVLLVLGYVLVKNEPVFLVTDVLHGLYKLNGRYLSKILASNKVHWALVADTNPESQHEGTFVQRHTHASAVIARSPQIFLGAKI